MSLEIVQRASDNAKEFKKKEEFELYYDVHKKEIDAQSTCMLNRKFKIDGFHLGREKGQLKLIPLNLYRPSEYQVNQENNLINIKIYALNYKIDNLSKQISRLLQMHQPDQL